MNVHKLQYIALEPNINLTIYQNTAKKKTSKLVAAVLCDIWDERNNTPSYVDQ